MARERIAVLIDALTVTISLGADEPSELVILMSILVHEVVDLAGEPHKQVKLHFPDFVFQLLLLSLLHL